MKAPFPWFGGKSRAAAEVWERFGDVANYVEPFAGSLAVLLGRPTPARIETVNDLDCWIANFWRALQNDPEGVATHADWPVNEADLHARHLWLVKQTDFRERMETDPEFFDVKIAGWWVWGICQWIGSGWCSEPNWRGRTNAGRVSRGIQTAQKRIRLSGFAEVGVHKKVKTRGSQRPALDGNGNAKVWQRIPNLGDQGRGVLASPVAEKRPRLGRGGRGVSRQLPSIGGDSGASGTGVHRSALSNEGLYEWLQQLAERLRRVRVCCGDWKRVLGPSVTEKIGITGIFLDPPYDPRAIGENEFPSDKLYVHHDESISAAVRTWALEHGDNPLLRIAVCGYEGEHRFPDTWTKFAWKANGGFSNQKGTPSKGAINSTRERIWFSPHCLSFPLWQ